MIPTVLGILTALGGIIASVLLSRYFQTKLIAATILCAIAFIYVGFSLRENPVELVILEVLIASGLYFVAIFGFSRNPFLIAYGIMFHGVWDLLHHHALVVETIIPEYWPLFCWVIDVIWGVYFLLYFKKQARAQKQ